MEPARPIASELKTCRKTTGPLQMPGAVAWLHSSTKSHFGYVIFYKSEQTLYRLDNLQFSTNAARKPPCSVSHLLRCSL